MNTYVLYSPFLRYPMSQASGEGSSALSAPPRLGKLWHYSCCNEAETDPGTPGFLAPVLQPQGQISTEGTCILLPPSSALIKTHRCTLKQFKCFGTSLGTAKGVQSEGKAGSLPSARWLACLSPAHVMHYKTARSLQTQRQCYNLRREYKAEVRNPWSS